ncbi:MAG: ribosomal protein S18-alanine N-acetyltransferase [Elusimicrobiota bacterium]
MNNFSIREMREADLPSVLSIEKESFIQPWSEQSFKKELSIKFSRFFVAENSDGEIAGFAGLWFYSGEGHIVNMAVKEEYRKSGIGKAFIEFLLSFARKNNLNSIFLEVASKNTAAIHLYESYGFKRYATRHNYYPQDNAILMSLKI